jgi:hypothetical protein
MLWSGEETGTKNVADKNIYGGILVVQKVNDKELWRLRPP